MDPGGVGNITDTLVQKERKIHSQLKALPPPGISYSWFFHLLGPLVLSLPFWTNPSHFP